MITEKLFKDSLNAIVNFTLEAEKISEITNGGIDLNMYNTLSKLEESLSKLLSYCVKDEDKEYIGTDIEYFLYDLDCGRDFESGMVTDENGNDIDMSSVDAMWEYFKKENPDIVDEENIEEDVAPYTDIDVEEIRNMFEEKGLHSTLSNGMLKEIFEEIFN